MPDAGPPRPPLGRDPSKDTRNYLCADCGAPTRRKRTSGEPLICVDCGVERAIEAARQMHARKGPLYDRFLEKRHPPGQARQP